MLVDSLQYVTAFYLKLYEYIIYSVHCRSQAPDVKHGTGTAMNQHLTSEDSTSWMSPVAADNVQETLVTWMGVSWRWHSHFSQTVHSGLICLRAVHMHSMEVNRCYRPHASIRQLPIQTTEQSYVSTHRSQYHHDSTWMIIYLVSLSSCSASMAEIVLLFASNYLKTARQASVSTKTSDSLPKPFCPFSLVSHFTSRLSSTSNC